MPPDWLDWHADYQDVASPLARRLRVVQQCLGDVLHQQPPGPVTLVSICAGQGLDVVGALADHARRADVHGRLVELDERLVAESRASIEAARLQGLEVLQADASLTDSYVDAVPANIVLACGLFGNISQEDIGRTIELLPELCSANAEVIWTRHRAPPDLVPVVRERFRAAGFVEEIIVNSPPYAIGVHRLAASPRALQPGQRMFHFFGFDALGDSRSTQR